jgi:hypothetical protein
VTDDVLGDRVEPVVTRDQVVLPTELLFESPLLVLVQLRCFDEGINVVVQSGVLEPEFGCPVLIEEGELSAGEDETDGVLLIPSAYMPRRGGQADAHPIFKRPESSPA